MKLLIFLNDWLLFKHVKILASPSFVVYLPDILGQSEALWRTKWAI